MFIKVKVFPGEKKEEIVKKSEDSYVIKVSEEAKEGRANERVKEILSAYFGVVPGKVRLIKGGKRQNKIFEVME